MSEYRDRGYASSPADASVLRQNSSHEQPQSPAYRSGPNTGRCGRIYAQSDRLEVSLEHHVIELLRSGSRMRTIELWLAPISCFHWLRPPRGAIRPLSERL